VLAQSQEEANRTISLAKKKAEELASRDAIMEAAQTRAEQIIDQARADAEAVRRDADDYIIETLGALESELTRLISQARNGIAKLTAEKHIALQTGAGSSETPEEGEE
jgi:dsDNA-specific endonuclease/ATPase MutS2